jgi:transposase/predicted HTH domain antitoxin
MTAMRRARHCSFSEAQCERIVHLYQDQKLSVERIAERMESNSMSVWRTLKRRGVEIRYNARQSMNHAQSRRLPALADVVRLYTVDLLSSTTIAERYGCHAQSIRHMLKGSGVTIRGKAEAALLSPSEWTDERVAMLKDLWPTGLKVDDIRERLGISYTSRAVSRKADELGLPRRCQQPKRSIKATEWRDRRDRAASGIATATQSQARLNYTIISFPEHPRLEMEWRHVLAAVRAERGTQWTELLGATR